MNKLPPTTNGAGSDDPARRGRWGGSDQATIRSLNRGLVLNRVKQEGPISRARVAQLTALTKPTVSAIFDELVADGLLTEIGVGQASAAGGRRPVLYRFNAGSYSLLGVHIGVEVIEVMLADGAGVEVDRTTEPTPQDPEVALRSALTMGERLLQGAAAGPISAIGIALPGLVDHRRGTCLLAPNLGWRDVDIPRLLGPRVDAAIAVHNVAQAALAAEHLEGAVQDCGDVVLLYEGHGAGAAILAEGRLFHGYRGTAGEIGHCKVPGGTQRCGCGGIGCLETEVSGRAILRRIRERSGGRLRPRSLRAAVDRGDPLIDAVLLDAGRELGRATATLVNVVNPQAVVVACGFLHAGDLLLEGLREALDTEALPEALHGVDVRRSALGEDGEVRGAVVLARAAAERAGDPIFGTDGMPVVSPLRR